VTKTPAERGRGEGEKKNVAPNNAAPEHRQPDLRASWLLRAACRYDLLREGVIDLDEAFDDQFVCDFLEATNCCPCDSAISGHFDRVCCELREERLRRWRRRARQ